MKKILLIFLLIFGIGLTTEYMAQSGGRKREKSSRKGRRRGDFILTQYKSRGHADEFARGGKHKGRFAKLFSKPKPSWNYKSSGSRRSQYKANKYLFTRYRSLGKKDNDMYLNRQHAYRNKHRVHGSKSFQRKRYNRG